MGNIRTFFEDKRNYDAVRKMCRYEFRNQEDAMDALHDIYLKLEDKKIKLPDDRDQALSFIHRMVINHKIDKLREKKKFPEIVDESHAKDVEQDGLPGHTEQLDRLDRFMFKNRRLFTEDQLDLWHCMYRDLSSEQMQIVMGRDAQAVYSLIYKLREKIRKMISREELL